MATYKSVALKNDIKVSYVEAGSSSQPTLLLLHGFPSSSNQFRRLIPLLSDKYHIIAPDLPFFGHTTVPDDLAATFANIADVIGQFLDTIGIQSFIVYVFDYGAPTAYRLALQRPDAFKGLIVQNGNAYEAGLADWWKPVKEYWATEKGSESYHTIREQLKGALSIEETRAQYVAGLSPEFLAKVDPNTYTLDHLHNLTGGNKPDRQLDLFYDYQTNVKLYPQFHEFFRNTKLPTLVVWGKHDPCFSVPGAIAYQTDLPEAEIKIIEEGTHFLLETHVDEVADAIKGFF